MVAGVNYDDLAEARRGYLNTIGSQLGVAGALRRDEANHVYDFDQYLQAQWDPSARWRLMAGVRNNSWNSRLTDTSPCSTMRKQRTLLGGEPGRRDHVPRQLRGQSYVSYGKGFETPTVNDLAYRSIDGSLQGLNLGLNRPIATTSKPASRRQRQCAGHAGRVLHQDRG